MQTSYGAPSKLTYRGKIVSDIKRVKSAPALEKLKFGSIGAFVGTSMNGIQNPSPNKLTFSGALVASNTINGTVSWKTIDSDGAEVLNSSAIAQVTYASSNANTLDLIKAAIEALDTKLTATVSGSDSIIVTHDDNAPVILSGFVVAAGSGQASVSYTFDGTLLGPVVNVPAEKPKTGDATVEPREMAGCLTQGIMTIYSEDAMTLASSLYAQFIDNGAIKRGEIRTGTDSSKAMAFSSLKPLSVVSADTLANVEINNP